MAGRKLFRSKAPWIMRGLINEFSLSEKQSAAILGNIGHECAGFTQMQEGSPIGGGRGGYGWCQWTGSRRTQFEAYAKKRGLNVDDDKANYGYLVWELHNTHKKAISSLRKYSDLEECVRVFEEIFEKADKRYKHYESRNEYANIALDEYESHSFDIAEAVLAGSEDTDFDLTDEQDNSLQPVSLAESIKISPAVTKVSATTAATSGFAAKLVQKAEDDLQTYKDLLEHQSPLKERIGEYWSFVNRPDLDGSDHEIPWSAAFISFMVHLAGAGKSFPYSAQHSTYIYRTINDKLTKKKTSFWGYGVGEIDIIPGDIIGMNRSGAKEISYDWASTHGDYFSHADIVVSVENKVINTIGGNVGKKPGQINRKKFGFSGSKLQNLSSGADQTAFVIIRSFLP